MAGKVNDKQDKGAMKRLLLDIKNAKLKIKELERQGKKK